LRCGRGRGRHRATEAGDDRRAGHRHDGREEAPDVTISGREVVGIRGRPEAKPFFEDYPAAAVVAPPDGSRGDRPTFVIEGVSELVMDLLAA
jgi:hypothetical protein